MVRTHTLVIGGGPAGATAARFLAGQGRETILVERNMSFVKPCGGGIPSTALEEFKIPHTIVRKEARKILVVSPRGEAQEIALTGGYLAMTDRAFFDKVLRELAGREGAVVTEGEFSGFSRTGKTIVSTVRRRIAGSNGRSSENIEIESDYIIAADGVTGKVGSALGIPRPPSLPTISTHITSETLSGSDGAREPGDCCEFWFGRRHAPGFYSWVFPSGDGFSIGTGGTATGDLGPLFRIFLDRRFGGRPHAMPEESRGIKRRIFRIPSGKSPLFCWKNVIFTGDAAGMVMPITYEGIYYAMKSGEFAAQAICENSPSMYRKLWEHAFRKRFLLMNTLRELLFGNDDLIEKWVTIHKRPEVQEIAMRIFLRKESGKGGLISYMQFLRHLL